jgi:hypothetical protein
MLCRWRGHGGKKLAKADIFLLSIYDKADAANISDKEMQERLKRLK